MQAVPKADFQEHSEQWWLSPAQSGTDIICKGNDVLLVFAVLIKLSKSEEYYLSRKLPNITTMQFLHVKGPFKCTNMFYSHIKKEITITWKLPKDF